MTEELIAILKKMGLINENFYGDITVRVEAGQFKHVKPMPILFKKDIPVKA